MGKHTQRKPDYFPAAAPVGLLLAGPVTATADTTHPLHGLPLDLRQTDSPRTVVTDAELVREATVATRGLPVSAPSSLGQTGRGAAGNSLTVVKSAKGFSQPPDAAGAALPPGSGQFTGDLRGGVGAHRSPNDSVDAGHLGSVAANSSAHGMGHFIGSLGDTGPLPGYLDTSQSLPTNAFHGNLPAGALAPAHAAATTDS